MQLTQLTAHMSNLFHKPQGKKTVVGSNVRANDRASQLGLFKPIDHNASIFGNLSRLNSASTSESCFSNKSIDDKDNRTIQPQSSSLELRDNTGPLYIVTYYSNDFAILLTEAHSQCCLWSWLELPSPLGLAGSLRSLL